MAPTTMTAQARPRAKPNAANAQAEPSNHSCMINTRTGEQVCPAVWVIKSLFEEPETQRRMSPGSRLHDNDAQRKRMTQQRTAWRARGPEADVGRNHKSFAAQGKVVGVGAAVRRMRGAAIEYRPQANPTQADTECPSQIGR